jgi:uncharacterized damage-inducible protein DinB
VTELPSDQVVPVSALFADVDEEFAATRRLLENHPDGHDDWRPHEKSMTLVDLAAHVASLPSLAYLIATAPEWNVETHPYEPPTARTREELLALFDETSAAAGEAIGRLGAAALSDPWRMRNGELVYFEGTRGPFLRRFLVSHTAHHRGQLTVYYRMLGAHVPGLYGPSADEMPGG